MFFPVPSGKGQERGEADLRRARWACRHGWARTIEGWSAVMQGWVAADGGGGESSHPHSAQRQQQLAAQATSVSLDELKLLGVDVNVAYVESREDLDRGAQPQPPTKVKDESPRLLEAQ